MNNGLTLEVSDSAPVVNSAQRMGQCSLFFYMRQDIIGSAASQPMSPMAVSPTPSSSASTHQSSSAESTPSKKLTTSETLLKNLERMNTSSLEKQVSTQPKMAASSDSIIIGNLDKRLPFPITVNLGWFAFTDPQYCDFSWFTFPLIAIIMTMKNCRISPNTSNIVGCFIKMYLVDIFHSIPASVINPLPILKELAELEGLTNLESWKKRSVSTLFELEFFNGPNSFWQLLKPTFNISGRSRLCTSCTKEQKKSMKSFHELERKCPYQVTKPATKSKRYPGNQVSLQSLFSSQLMSNQNHNCDACGKTFKRKTEKTVSNPCLGIIFQIVKPLGSEELQLKVDHSILIKNMPAENRPEHSEYVFVAGVKQFEDGKCEITYSNDNNLFKIHHSNKIQKGSQKDLGQYDLLCYKLKTKQDKHLMDWNYDSESEEEKSDHEFDEMSD